MRAQCATSDRGWGKLFLGLGGDMNVGAPFPFYTTILPSNVVTVSNQLFVCLPRCAFNCNGWYNGEIYTVVGVSVPIGCWSFISIIGYGNSNSNRQLKAYINGELHGMVLVNSPPSNSGAVSPFSNVNAVYESFFGVNHPDVPAANQFYFDGKLDEFYFYEFAIDLCDLQNLSNQVIQLNQFDFCNADTISFSCVSNENLTTSIWLKDQNILAIGDTLRLNSNAINNGDTLTFVYKTEFQCENDTVFFIPEIASSNLVQVDTIFICNNDSAYIFGLWTNIAGTYSDTFSVGFCDSIQFIELMLSDTINVSQNLISCHEINYNGTLYTSDTTIIESLLSTAGCDSIITTLILINDTASITNTLIPFCDSTMFYGEFIQTDTLIQKLLTTASGCDSLVNYTFMYSGSYYRIDSIDTCFEYTDFLGVDHLKSETVSYQFQTSTGCDSIIVLYITIRNEIDDECQTDSCVLAFPNIITPNNDGQNDVFKDLNGCDETTGSLFIYNRWGNLIYCSANGLPYWDGSRNGEFAINGIYFYVFETAVGMFTGSFTILR